MSLQTIVFAAYTVKSFVKFLLKHSAKELIPAPNEQLKKTIGLTDVFLAVIKVSSAFKSFLHQALARKIEFPFSLGISSKCFFIYILHYCLYCFHLQKRLHLYYSFVNQKENHGLIHKSSYLNIF